MFEYKVWHDDYGDEWIPKRYICETPSKAKYQHFKYLTDELNYGMDFRQFTKNLKCKKVGIASINFFFGDTEQFERTIKSRGIEFAYQGMKIHVCGKSGKIVGANSSCNLDVVFDEDFLRGQPHKRNCHPLYMTKYFDRQDNLIAEYKD